MKSILIEKDFSKSLSYPKKLLLFSTTITIISSLITIFNFQFSWLIKLLICLSIFCFVLIIDVISLYIKQYEYYYQMDYFNKIYNLIHINLNNLSKELDKATENLEHSQLEINEIRKVQNNIMNSISLLKSNSAD